jgi:peptidoglycan/LPS O-acetylase OafA/YrhL
MQCRSCGTEIADKAIVCYRCGAATTDPVRKAAPLRRPSPVPVLVGAALLVLLAVYAYYASATALDPEPWRMAAAVLVGAALVVLVRGLVRRRGRRTPLR